MIIRLKSHSRVFRRRIAIGSAAVASLCVIISVVSVYALRTVIESKDLVISDYTHNLLRVRELEVLSEQEVSSSRAFLLTRDTEFEARAARSRREFAEAVADLRNQIVDPERALLDRVGKAEEAHRTAMALAIARADGSNDPRKLSQDFEQIVMPKREELRESFGALVEAEEQQLEASLKESGRSARRMSIVVVVIGLSSAIVAGFLFDLNRRTLRRLAHAEQEVSDLNQVLESRVVERTAELTRTVKELEGFAYTVAHDLRAPLRGMSGLSQLMVEDFGKELKAPGPEYLTRIQAASQRMDQLINGLLEFSRLSYSELNLHPIEVRDAVAAAVMVLEGEIEKCHGQVDIADCTGMAVATEPFLRQILVNLIGNAIKFIAAGVAPRVRVRTEPIEKTLRIWVEDNGIGISPEYRERIFGVFERLNPAENYPGTGIGLAIVRKAAERMGGKVGVESKPGGGSRFWVELPLAVASKLQAAG